MLVFRDPLHYPAEATMMPYGGAWRRIGNGLFSASEKGRWLPRLCVGATMEMTPGGIIQNTMMVQ
jgi:hypothetical protein